MPWVPLLMPSLTPMVPNPHATKPAFCTPSFTCAANPFRCMLQGLLSKPVLAMPTWASFMVSSIQPCGEQHRPGGWQGDVFGQLRAVFVDLVKLVGHGRVPQCQSTAMRPDGTRFKIIDGTRPTIL